MLNGWSLARWTLVAVAAVVSLHPRSPATPPASQTAASPAFQMPPATLALESAQGPVDIPNMDSSNWAGLTQTGHHETSVTASWTAPTTWAAPVANRSSVGEWIGLGGVNSSDLIQIGTITSPDFQGQPKTTAFWEVLPADASTDVTIPNGTVVTASITPMGLNTWSLQLITPGRAAPWISKRVQLTPKQIAGIETSADWITERVSTADNRMIPLAPFGSLTMANVRANGVSLSGMPVDSLEGSLLVDHGGQIQAAPVYHPGNPDALTVVERPAGAPVGTAAQAWAHWDAAGDNPLLPPGPGAP